MPAPREAPAQTPGYSGFGQVSEVGRSCLPPSPAKKAKSIAGTQVVRQQRTSLPRCVRRGPGTAGEEVLWGRSWAGSNAMWPSAPKQRTMPRGVPRGTRQQSSRSIVSSCRSTRMRESFVISAEVRCDTALPSEAYGQDINRSQQYFQNHLHNRFFCMRTPGPIAQASSSTASYQAFRVWLHIPLASPRLFTHDRGHDETFPGEANGAGMNRDGVHA